MLFTFPMLLLLLLPLFVMTCCKDDGTWLVVDRGVLSPADGHH